MSKVSRNIAFTYLFRNKMAKRNITLKAYLTTISHKVLKIYVTDNRLLEVCEFHSCDVQERKNVSCQTSFHEGRQLLS